MPTWCNHRGRCAWDLMAVILAVRGPRGFYQLEAGTNVVDPHTGRNQWVRQANQSASGSQFQAGLVPALAILVGDEIDELLLRVPAAATHPSPTPPLRPGPSLPPPLVPPSASPSEPSPGVPLPASPPPTPWPPALHLMTARASDSPPAMPPWPPLHPYGSRGFAFGDKATAEMDTFQLMDGGRGPVAAVAIGAAVLCAISSATLFRWSRRAALMHHKKAPGFERASVHPWDESDDLASSRSTTAPGNADLLQRTQQSLARIDRARARDHRELIRHETVGEHSISLLSLSSCKDAPVAMHGSRTESVWRETSTLSREVTVDHDATQPSCGRERNEPSLEIQQMPPAPGLQRI